VLHDAGIGLTSLNGMGIESTTCGRICCLRCVLGRLENYCSFDNRRLCLNALRFKMQFDLNRSNRKADQCYGDNVTGTQQYGNRFRSFHAYFSAHSKKPPFSNTRAQPAPHSRCFLSAVRTAFGVYGSGWESTAAIMSWGPLIRLTNSPMANGIMLPEPSMASCFGFMLTEK
jgi:hypothetical protein